MKKYISLFITFVLISMVYAQIAETPAGQGTETNPYQIETLNHLYWISVHSECWSDYFIQIADIDASDTQNWNDIGTSEDILEGFSPIGNHEISFEGFYNGQGHSVSQLTINRDSSAYNGLFGILNTGRIENLSLLQSSITGSYCTGALIGTAVNAEIENCSVSGIINANVSCGGLVGILSESSILSNCVNNASVSGVSNTGGIVGEMYQSEINNSTNTGEVFVSGSNSSVGGIVGFSTYSVVTLCTNEGSINGEVYYIGGICGYDRSTVTFCTNNGELNSLKLTVGALGGISGGHSGYVPISFCSNYGTIYYNLPEYVGGITGTNCESGLRYCQNFGQISGLSNHESDIGGISGSNQSGIIKKSFNAGMIRDSMTVSNIGRNLGGICGENGYYSVIEDCYNTGQIQLLNYSASSGTAGIAGMNNIYSLIINAYSTGSVMCTIPVAICYYNERSSVKNSFWNSEESNIEYGVLANNGNGTIYNVQGLTTAQMKDMSTYTTAGWDFQNVWQIDPEINEGYPSLIWSNDPLDTDQETLPVVMSEKPVLNSAYPNPFNPSTTISFTLSNPERVNLDIFNVKGQKVKNLLNEYQSKGLHSIVWNGESDQGAPCASGIYFYKLQTTKSSQSRKMILVK